MSTPIGRRTVLVGCAAIPVICGTIATADPLPRVKWAICYGETADESMLAAYDIVVLDPGFRGSIAAITERAAAGKRPRVCAYLSLGESRETSIFHQRIDPAGLLSENPNWPGSWLIDVRHPSWKLLVTEQMIPSFAQQGFTGLMLDTLDTPPYLEEKDPLHNAGMGQAARDLVRTIRQSFPEMMVIMNRGYALLPGLIDSIDALIAESLLTSPVMTGLPSSVGDRRYEWNKSSLVGLQMNALMSAKASGLPILSLDYWDPKDTATIADIYLRERSIGHQPYVATATLEEVVPEPPLKSRRLSY